MKTKIIACALALLASGALGQSRFSGFQQLRSGETYLDIVSFFSPGTNGAGLDTLNGREEGYVFDSATAETLYVKTYVPSWFTSVDSVWLITSANSTDGDSVKWDLAWIARANTESTGGAVGTALSSTVDLGTTANTSVLASVTGTFSNIVANDVVLWQLVRDVSVANDEAGDVRVTDVVIWIH